MRSDNISFMVAIIVLASVSVGCSQTARASASGCGSPATSLPPGGYRFDGTMVRTEFPFDLVGNHILIPVQVNGSAPFHLVLDTGMPLPGALLHPGPRADALALENPAGLRLSIAGQGGDPPRLGTDVVLGLPGVELTGQIVGVTPLPGCGATDRAAEGASGNDAQPSGLTTAEGVIGGSVFGSLVVKIDYERKRIALIDPEHFAPEPGWQSIPITFGPTQMPEVDCAIELSPGRLTPVSLVVDTGAVFAVSLTLGTDDGIALPDGARDCVVGFSNWGRLTGSLGRAGALRIGEFTLRDVLVTFLREGAPGVPPCGKHGILGNEALARFTTTFDYHHRLMYMAPNSRLREPFEFCMGGVGIERTQGGRLRITHVVDDSPASEAGLREGDEIIRVDNRPAEETSVDAFRALMRREGALVHLQISREGTERTVALRLRRLV